MIKIKEAIIVEGKYDRMRLKPLFDTAIIETGGFRIFNDKEKRAIIRSLARSGGIIILTDSDGAGFVIRNYLKGAVAPDMIKQAYIPEIKGKERRKSEPSKQGLLGVEGMTDEIIINAVLNSGASVDGELSSARCELTKADLYELGLSGRDNSAEKRERLLEYLGFPKYMTANALLSALGMLYTKQDISILIKKSEKEVNRKNEKAEGRPI